MGYSAMYIRVIYIYINQSSCTNCLDTQITPPMAVSCHWHKTGLLATVVLYLIHTLRTPGSSLSAPHLSREARMSNVSPIPTPLPPILSGIWGLSFDSSFLYSSSIVFLPSPLTLSFLSLPSSSFFLLFLMVHSPDFPPESSHFLIEIEIIY